MTTQSHLVLLGDSIFDNGAYVPKGPAVIDHLRRILPPDWQATLLAHDGDVTANIEGQLSKLPKDATHLVISVGGNDALGVMGVFSLPAETVNDALTHLAEIRRDFQRAYRTMLWQVLSVQLPLAVCTIYDAIPELQVQEQTALAIFNDTIAREAFGAKVPVIDLRHVCTEAPDYSPLSPIEPSAEGGRKIAIAIAAWVLNSRG
jgi:lysophospholipase L1-like esterase